MKLNPQQVKALCEYGERIGEDELLDVTEELGAYLLDRIQEDLASVDPAVQATCEGVLSVVAGGAAEICLRAGQIAAEGFEHGEGGPSLSGDREDWANFMPAGEVAVGSFHNRRGNGLREIMGVAWRECQMTLEQVNANAGRLAAMETYSQALEEACFVCARNGLADAYAEAQFETREDVGAEVFRAGAENALKASTAPNAPEAPMDVFERVIGQAKREGALAHVRMMLNICSTVADAFMTSGGSLADAVVNYFDELGRRASEAAVAQGSLSRLDAAKKDFKAFVDAIDKRIEDSGCLIDAGDTAQCLLSMEQVLGRSSMDALRWEGIAVGAAVDALSEEFNKALGSIDGYKRLMLEMDGDEQDLGRQVEQAPEVAAEVAAPEAPEDSDGLQGPNGQDRRQRTRPRFGL